MLSFLIFIVISVLVKCVDSNLGCEFNNNPNNLTCKIRTLNQATEVLRNLTDTSKIRVLHLECSDVLFFESHFDEQFFANFDNLEEISIEKCKIKTIPKLLGYNGRSFTLRTLNADWSTTMTLDLTVDSFVRMRVEHLDLSANNIWTIPARTFCPLTSNLTFLNISANKLEFLREFALDCKFANLQILDVSANKLRELFDLQFAQLINLREIYLQKNAITKVGDRVFAMLPNLLKIDLSDNFLVQLPPDLLQSALRAQHLNFARNNLSVLAPGVFEALADLKYLDLSENNLHRFVIKTTFRGLVRLVDLNLSGNTIGKLENGVFRDLGNLQILNLDHNNLTAIENDVFANLTNLQDLSLNANAFSGVPVAISHLHNLKTLDLGKNRIKNLTNASFLGLVSLYGLRMVDNELTQIARDVFSQLEALQVLNLASNRINFIAQSAFRANFNLKAIRLDSNELVDITGVFTNCDNLLWLNVSNNQIAWFDFSYLPQSVEWLDMHLNSIQSLDDYHDVLLTSRIKSLDVGFNLLERLGPKSLPNSVETFLANNNNIKNVEINTFQAKTRLVKVVLYGNAISQLELAALAISGPDREVSVYLGGNPIICDCRMEWLLRINSLRGGYPKVGDLEEVRCEMPRGKVRDLLELAPRDFLCRYEKHCFAVCHCCDFDACDCKMTCPANCTCWNDMTWTNNIVDCSGVGYTHVPPLIPMDVTELRLDGNNLTELPPHLFIGKKKLERLFLNASHISVMHNRTFNGIPKLRALHLDHNELRELKGDEFEQLANLRELYLGHNELNRIPNAIITQLSNISVFDLTGNNFTSKLQQTKIILLAKTNFLPILSAILVAAILVGVAAAILFAFRSELKLYFHRKINKPNLHDRLYDCYVIYSEFDCNWTVNVIAPELENGGHTLCLHYRDLQNGAYLMAAMLTAAEASRKVVLIITPGLLRHEWTLGEFRAACLQMRAPLVCLVMATDDVCDDVDMRKLMQGALVLRWGDKRFWEKLRFGVGEANKVVVGEARYTPTPSGGDDKHVYSTIPEVGLGGVRTYFV